MPFPNYPNKHSLSSMLTADDIVDYRRHLGRIPKGVDSLKGVLFCLERGLPRRLRGRIGVRKAGSMLGDLYTINKAKGTVAVIDNFGGGSPIVAELAEEFVAMGVTRLIVMTWGGALQKELKPGDIVVCDRAIRDEGTSQHYLPPGKTIAANPELVERLANEIRARGAECTVGTTWTTDAPYRESREEVQQYQAEGVQTVEMEAAGLFAIGQVREIQTAAVVVILDSLANLEWEVPDRLDTIQKSLEVIYTASIDALTV